MRARRNGDEKEKERRNEISSGSKRVREDESGRTREKARGGEHGGGSEMVAYVF